jgi:Spy/CpxP family protein refolding chaperone
MMETSTPEGRSATLRAALWIGAVFLLGAALGGVLGYVFAHRPVNAAAPPQSEQQRRASRVAELTRELSLTPQQAQQLDEILVKWHAETKAIRDQSDAQVESIRQKGRSEVRSILTPDQLPKFEAFLKRLDEERKHNPPPR